MLVEPGRTFYPKVGRAQMAAIVDAVARGAVLDDLLFVDPQTGGRIARQDDLPFYRDQVRAILSRNEQVDPIRIYTYIEHGGYAALLRVLERGDPRWAVEGVKASGLRGRGGAGFPTGRKWSSSPASPGPAASSWCATRTRATPAEDEWKDVPADRHYLVDEAEGLKPEPPRRR